MAHADAPQADHPGHQDERQDEGQDEHKGQHQDPHQDPHQGHQDHHAHMAADFRKRFWIALVLTLPILALSPLLQTLVSLREAVRFPGDLYVLF